jgi:hypothetical protein
MKLWLMLKQLPESVKRSATYLDCIQVGLLNRSKNQELNKKWEKERKKWREISENNTTKALKSYHWSKAMFYYFVYFIAFKKIFVLCY